MAGEIEEARIRVEEARRALDDDVATLTERLPAAALLAQAGAAGGVGLALLGAVAKVVQGRMARRSEEKALSREAEIQARAIAAAMAAAGLYQRSAPPDAGDGERDGGAAPSRPGPAPAAASPATGADDDGPPWGILLLLAAVIAAVVALVTARRDDDVWATPGQGDGDDGDTHDDGDDDGGDDGGAATSPPGVVEG